MKAMVFYGPGDLRYEDIPVPDPGPGEALVRIEAALTCGTDVKTLRRGHPVMIPRVPTVFGHELAGTVTAVGRGVKTVWEGDRVVAANSAPCGDCPRCRGGRANLCEDLLFVNGAYGEYIALPPRLVERNLVRIGRNLPAARAAFAEPLACALGGIDRGRVEAGQSVAIFGVGPLGCLLALAAGARKARVILVGKPGWRLTHVRNLELAECFEADGTSSVAEAIRDLTGGKGVDVAVDATGRPEVWEQAVDSVARGGTVVLFGGCAPGTSIRVDTRRTHYEELTLTGAFHHTPELIRRAVEMLDGEALRPDGLITHRMSLPEVRRALDLMARGEALKVLISSEGGSAPLPTLPPRLRGQSPRSNWREAVRRLGLLLSAALVALLSWVGAAAAADPAEEFSRGTKIIGLQFGGGAQNNVEGHRTISGISFVNVEPRFSILPFDPIGSGILKGSVETGLAPFFQYYLTPDDGATAEGMKAIARYHFLSASPIFPYAEVTAGAAGTSLKVSEIRSTFTFILEAGAGVSYFVTDGVALNLGYRFQHISNGNTSQPNRGFNSDSGVLGVSFFFH